MKRTIFINMLIASACLISACGQATKDSTAKADSINNARDPKDTKNPYTYQTEVSGDDAKFAVEATNGSIVEIELGKIAQQKASDARVKAFGKMMIKDHTAANTELMEISKSKKITLPASLNSESQKLVQDLEKKSGTDFDKAYVKAMVNDHKDDIAEFEHGEKIAKYPEMLAFIKKTLPVLHKHLSEIQKIAGK